MASRQADIYAVVGVTLPAATSAFFLRLTARRMTGVQLGWDDYLAAGAWVTACAWSALVLLWLQDGLGLFLGDIRHLGQKEATSKGLLLLYFAELCYALSLALSKLSILSFYWRLFKRSNIKRPIQVLFVASVVWLILRIFLGIFHCVPVQGFWDKTLESVCLIDDSKFFFGTVLTHLIIDVAILALPVFQIGQLQLRTAQKIAVTALFMFGILVCLASIVVIVTSLQFDPLSIEMPWNIAPIMIWATVEVNLAIVSACLPMLRPIFNAIWPTSPLRSEAHSSRSNMGIRLRSLVRTKSASGSSSTYQLTDAEHGTGQPVGGFEPPARDGFMGPQTKITGRAHAPPSRQGDESVEELQGITVRSEMSVRISHAQR